MAVETYRPGMDGNQTDDAARQAGLARSGLADERISLAWLDRERDVGDGSIVRRAGEYRGNRAPDRKSDRQILDLKQRFHAGGSCSALWHAAR